MMMSQSSLLATRAPLPFHGLAPQARPSLQARSNLQASLTQRCPSSATLLSGYVQPLAPNPHTAPVVASGRSAEEPFVIQPQEPAEPFVFQPQEPFVFQPAKEAAEKADGVDDEEPEDEGSEVDDEDSDDEGREACENLAGLVRHLDLLESDHVRIIEVTHVVNKWHMYGVVGKHHGLIFKTSTMGYIRAHLVQDGLAWKVYESCPACPDTTCYTKTYTVDASASALRSYCQNAKPWSWPSNDCEKWAHGALKVVGVQERPYHSFRVQPDKLKTMLSLIAIA